MSLVLATMDRQTMRPGVQPSGIGAAETGESVTLGRSRKRKRWDSQRSFTPDHVTLGALRRGVKYYNVGLNSSMILGRCGACRGGAGHSTQGQLFEDP
jgi:hypothetical protein